jgi:MFS transporter, NNP family, nitrate/nitrite transporter
MAGEKATRIDLFSLSTPQMRAFHMTWLAFFSVFFAWFGIAPLMPVVRDDLGLTTAQIGNTAIASVAVTVLVRLLIGPLCDRYGPRLTYSALLIIGSLPVMGIGLARSYESFLLFRLAIGAIGAAFVITQYHTTMMFAPNVVGTANATTAGWGNLGGGITQMVMPLVLAAMVLLGASESVGWRLAMVVPGVVLFLLGIAYYRFTQDTPEGNYSDMRRPGGRAAAPGDAARTFARVARDHRVWALFVVYGCCFGVELTINNVAALYFHDRFSLSVALAGVVAGLHGTLNVFGRTLGGYLSDRFAARWGLSARVNLLFAAVLLEGLALMLFSRMGMLPFAIATLLLFSLFVQMSCGATYGVVPFVDRRALGTVAGIVGAGGNAGAVAAGFLFRSDSLAVQQAFLYLGIAVTAASIAALAVRLSPETAPADALAAGRPLVSHPVPAGGLVEA